MVYQEVWIIGGGAAGLAAAVTAAGLGKQVGVIEHKESVGKKLTATGNGKCNFTNEYQGAECFHSDDPSFPSKVLKQWSCQDTLDFFSSMGIYPRIKNGYVYPRSEQASSVVSVLRMEAVRLGVLLICSEHVTDVTGNAGGFKILTVEKDTGKQKTHQGAAVILCTGGMASKALGSDGSGYELAKKLGHHIRPVVPALMGLKAFGTFFKAVSGVRVQAEVSLHINGSFCAKDKGELQLASYGISGIPVFQVSRFGAKALREGKTVEAVIDFFTEESGTDVLELLYKRCLTSGKSAEEMLIGLLNQKLAVALLRESGIKPETAAGKIGEGKLKTLAGKMKEFKIKIVDTNGFDQAQVTAGGIDTTEVDCVTMESKKRKGLYFAGEILDVDGCCGGYNLHWAWATGVLAGRSVC